MLRLSDKISRLSWDEGLRLSDKIWDTMLRLSDKLSRFKALHIISNIPRFPKNDYASKYINIHTWSARQRQSGRCEAKPCEQS